MAGPAWTNIPTDVLDATSMTQKADDWAKDQMSKVADDWADQQHLSAPVSSDSLTNPLGTGNAPAPSPEPAAGDSAPSPELSAGASFPAPPVFTPAASTTLPAPDAPAPLDLSRSAPVDRTSQFAMGLSSADAMAFCGPAAAIAFAKTYGRNPTVQEARQLAQSVGWNPNQGMAGVQSEQALLTKMGVQTKLEQGINWDHVAQDANNGNPVIIDTPGHYFYVTGARQGRNGMEFNVGTSGTDLRAGATWMSPMQMAQTMGSPRAALYADHPMAQGPSQAEKTPVAQVNDALGGAFAAVGKKAQDVAQAVTSVGQTDQPGPPIQGDYTAALPGGRQDPLEAAQQAVGQVAGAVSDWGMGKSPLSPSNVLQGAETALGNNIANDPLVKLYQSDARRELLPNITDPNHPLNVLATLTQKRSEQGQLSPEDEAAYNNAIIAVGGMTGPVSGGGEMAKAGSSILQDALNALKGYSDDVAGPIRDWAQQAVNKGTPASEVGSTIKRWVQENPAPKNDLAAPEVTRLEPEVQATLPQGPTEDDLMAQWQQQLDNVRKSKGYQAADPVEQSQMVSNAMQDFQAESAQPASRLTPEQEARYKALFGDDEPTPTAPVPNRGPQLTIENGKVVPGNHEIRGPAGGAPDIDPYTGMPKIPATWAQVQRISREYAENVPPAASRGATEAKPPLPSKIVSASSTEPSAPVVPSESSMGPAPSVSTPTTAKMSDLPAGLQSAVKDYLAVAGRDSAAARVASQQAVREFQSSGVSSYGVDITNAEDAGRAAYTQTIQDAKAKLDSVLQNYPGWGDRAQSVIDTATKPSAVPNMPILGGLQRAQQEIKGVIFPLSMFHAYTEGLYSAFSRPGGAAEFASAFFSKSPTEAAQNSPMWLRAAKGGVTHLFDAPAAPDAQNVASGLQGAAIRAGIGGVGGAAAGYTESKIAGDTDEQAGVNALAYGLAGATGAVAAKPLISDNLWRAVQYSKVKTFETLVNSGMDDQVAAAAVNRTYGGLNYAQMGRDQTFQDLLRLTVQAPDWGESTLRQLGSAFFGRDAGAGFSRGLVARTVLGTAFATEVMNMAFTGHPSWENEPGHQFQVQLPSDTADKPVYVGIGPGNLQAYVDLAAKIGKDPSQAIIGNFRGQRQPGDIPDFIGNRVATIPSAGYELATGNAFGGTKAPLVAEVGSKAAPISVSTAVQAQHEGMSPLAQALLLGAGANPRYGSGADQRPIRPTRGAPEPGPMDFLSGLFSTASSSGRNSRPKRGQ